MRQPAYRRLDVDERRRRLLARGVELFERFSYDELSMAKIAREAGISKALLYHYFPSKQAYFVATLEQAAAELATAVEPDPAHTPLEQLTHSLDAYLAWVDTHADAYEKLMRSVGAVPEVRDIVDRVRRETADRIVAGIAGAAAAASPPAAAPSAAAPSTAATAGGVAPPSLRAAVRGWLWFMDGVLEDWLEHRDMDRDALRSLLLGTLLGAVTAAGVRL